MYRITVQDAHGDVLVTFNRLRPLEPGDLIALPDGTTRRVSKAGSKFTGHDPEPQLVSVDHMGDGQES